MFDSLDEGSTARALATRATLPPAQREPAGFWSGVLSAVPRGVGAAAVESARPLAPMVTTGATVAFPATPQSLDLYRDTDRKLGEIGRALKPDPQDAGIAAQVLFDFARVGTKIAGGAVAGGVPGAVAAGGLGEGTAEFNRLRDAGVDRGTAAAAGAVRGVATAVGVALPLTGATLPATVWLVAAGGPGLFVAEQIASRELLQRAGYDKLAAEYDPLDPVGLIVSTLLPAGVATVAMRGRRARGAAAADGEAATLQAAATPDPTPASRQAAEDAARVRAVAEVPVERSLVRPEDVTARNAEADALVRAEDAMARGEPVRVADSVPGAADEARGRMAARLDELAAAVRESGESLELSPTPRAVAATTEDVTFPAAVEPDAPAARADETPATAPAAAVEATAQAAESAGPRVAVPAGLDLEARVDLRTEGAERGQDAAPVTVREFVAQAEREAADDVASAREIQAAAQCFIGGAT